MLAGSPLIVLLSLAVSAATDDGPAINRAVGQPVAPFQLPDASNGSEIAPIGHDGTRAVVLVFTGLDCPIGNLYMPRLVELSRKYQDRRVSFYGINSNLRQKSEEIAAQSKEFGLPFPILRDEDGSVALALQAERTCEVLVVDAAGVLRYRGAIDDQYGLGFPTEAPRHHYLSDALDAVLDGQVPDTQASSVVGCPIEFDPARVAPRALADLDTPGRVNRLIGQADRIRPPSAEMLQARAAVYGEEDALVDRVGPVTYQKDIAPIIQGRCESCHRPGEVGPFPLTSYDEVSRRLTGIAEVVDSRRMPPWHADPRYGHFANDRSLSPDERARILAWIEQGAPAGDSADAPPPPEYPQGWTIGEPDVVVKMDRPYAVKSDGFLQYQHFVVDPGFREDRWIQAAEARPSDRGVVHHIIAYMLRPGEQMDPGRDHLCGYAPGDMPTVYPTGTAKKVPAGTRLLLEIHYTPNGKVRYDQSSVGLIFAKQPIEREGRTFGIFNERIKIAANDPNSQWQRDLQVRNASRIMAFMPHMHLRGKSFRYELSRAGGPPEVLLSVPDYDFGWQSYYTLKEPIDVAPGDRIICHAAFDNSAQNPVNPDPSVAVGWGEQTWEEMMIGYMDVSTPLPSPLVPDRLGRVSQPEAE